MLPEALSLSELVIKVISTFRITKTNRKKIAKLFTSLYHDLEMLVENGDRILKLLRRHNNGYRINYDKLYEMLREQQVIINRINSLLKRRDVSNVLSLRAKRLRPLNLLINQKSSRIDLILECNGTRNRNFDIDFFPPRRFLSRRRVMLPNNTSIDKSRKNLRQIQAKLDELRSFIVENFEIHEVM